MISDPDRLAYWLLKDLNKAIRDYQMIADGDRVAVAVSGGKDSLSLLRLLDVRRDSVPEGYTLVAIHVVGDANGPDLPRHEPLISWLDSSGYQYAVEPMHLPEGEALPMNCQRCTWNRRRTLFEVADRLKCNVVALGHHANDLAQTTLLNLLYHGRVETMSPASDYFEGRFRLVRPLCYLPEKNIRRFAEANNFPSPPPACPVGLDSRRQFVAELLKQAEAGCQDARVNLLRAGLKSISSQE
jgi:tRNA 2-thiocytidine biosynthesis protein TtcA